jgi:hypothetical protein
VSQPQASVAGVAVREFETKAPLVCIVILNYNGAQITLDCVGSVLKILYPNFKVVVVDNGSTDDSVARFKEALADPRIELLVNPTNEGYAGGNNRGIERALEAGAEYVFVLNNDVLAEPGCLAPLVQAMEQDKRIGVAGCPLIDIGYESSPNLGQGISLFSGKTWHWPHQQPPHIPTDVDFICGAAVMLRSETLRRIGAFDAGFFLLCEDADLCFRARRAGYRVCFVPGPGVRHIMSATTKRVRPRMAFYSARNRVWLIRRHGSLGQRIVFYLLVFCYEYPKSILGGIIRRQFHLLGPTLKGIWEGHWSRPGVSR